MSVVLITLLVYSNAQVAEYLAHLGLRETEMGQVYTFSKVYKGLIEINLDNLAEIKTKSLDCDKYRSSPPKTRSNLEELLEFSSLPTGRQEVPFGVSNSGQPALASGNLTSPVVLANATVVGSRETSGSQKVTLAGGAPKVGSPPVLVTNSSRPSTTKPTEKPAPKPTEKPAPKSAGKQQVPPTTKPVGNATRSKRAVAESMLLTLTVFEPKVSIWYQILDNFLGDWVSFKEESELQEHVQGHPEDVQERAKRSVEKGGLLSVGEFKRCLYPFNGQGNELESEEEERYWNELMAKNVTPPIYCEFESSDNCHLRAIHREDMSVYWKKRYNFKKRTHYIEKSYDLVGHKQANFTFKETMYHTKKLVEAARKGEPIEMSYRCLADPYRRGLVPEDPLLKFLRENKERILNSVLVIGSNRKLATNKTRVVDRTSSKFIMSHKKLVDPEPKVNLTRALTEDYQEFNNKIETGLSQLSNLEKEILREIEKVDQSVAIGRKHDSTVSTLCFNWLRTKDWIDLQYENRQTLVDADTEISKAFSNLTMTEDLKLVCLNAALLKRRENAILLQEAIREDEYQRKLMTTLGVNYTINKNGVYNIDSKVEEFKNLPVYDSFKFVILEAEREILLAQRVERETADRLIELRVQLEERQRKIQQFEEERNLTTGEQSSLQSQLLEATKKKQKIEELYQELVDEMARANLALQNSVKRMETRYHAIYGVPVPFQVTVPGDKKLIENAQNHIAEIDMLMDVIESGARQEKTERDQLYRMANETADRMDELNKQLKALESEVTTKNQQLLTANNQVDQLEQAIAQKEEDIKNLKIGELVAENQKRSLEARVSNLIKQQSNSTAAEEFVKLSQLRDQYERERDELTRRLNILRERRLKASRFKREVEDRVEDRLFRFCNQLNQNLQEINSELQKENQLSRQALNQNRRGKRALPIIALVALGMSIGSGIGLGVEEYARQSSNYIIKETIRVHYNEFVKSTNLANSLHDRTNMQISSIWQNLETLNEHVDKSSTFLTALKDEILKVKEYSVLNRVWLTFLSDLQEVQRLIVAVISKNTQQNRLLSSFAQLRAGYLAPDFVSATNLTNFIRKITATLPKELELAFNETELMSYYQFPLSKLYIQRSRMYIEINFPAISKAAKERFYHLKQIDNKPFKCWDLKLCKKNKTYKFELPERYVWFAPSNLSDPIGSTNRESLECFGSLDKHLCWTTTDGAPQLEGCLKQIYDRQFENHQCVIKEQPASSSALAVSYNSFYETVYSEDGVLFGRTDIGTGKDVQISESLSIHDYLGDRNDSLKSLSFEDPNTAEIKKQVEKGREILSRMNSDIKKQFEYFHNRTSDDLFKETGMDEMEVIEPQKTKPWNYIQVMIALLPYVIGLAALIKTNFSFITRLASAMVPAS